MENFPKAEFILYRPYRGPFLLKRTYLLVFRRSIFLEACFLFKSEELAQI